ncbi:transglycosylase domain-containing protein [Puniceibacterium sp. IMCC21224]|uniref:transglycosylase domain-containing protein n=1 Tax=Puniceibacterium sp. IMCC21224 TaxID=1618204 RepID=UPI00064D8817|nr:PBP1A family penicillin-binding protein [Puniceibacterium sp. IMCC21224]KMK65327.1 penicillin-binding protein, 1A family [Puniceibacterium sp. IMCC21224]
MSDSGRGKGRLVADRRYPKSGGSKSTGTKKPVAKSGVTKRAPAKSRRKTAPRRPRNRFVAFILGIILWPLRILWRITWRLTAVCLLVLGSVVAYTYTTLPPLQALLDGRAQGSVTLLDRDSRVFAWRGDQFGGVVTAESVSPYLSNAVIATEDRRFRLHPGIDPIGIASAVSINLREGRGPLQGHGGSTITQQTAKLICLGVDFDSTKWENEKAYVAECRRSSLARKAKEAIYALAMEIKYTKDDILSIYLNRAYLGGGAYGAEAAAQRYFGKPASAVNAAEAAMLAGLLTAPSTLAPTSNIERSRDRASVVLSLMANQGYLTKAEADDARAHPAALSDAAEARAGGYFADWVMDTIPEFASVESRQDVEIRTTLDPRLQTAAENAMKAIFSEKVREGSKAQAAIVVMSADGAVRAMVGGRKTGVSGVFNRATQAKRQTGSAFKPFVYATALELGYGPFDTVVDEPYCLNIPGSGQWCPKNYTNTFKGRVTLTAALENSLNIPAVKISESVGRDLVRRVADDFGLASDLSDTPALALGASESTLLEMTGAYAGILNGGSSVRPYGLTELRIKGDPDPMIGQGGGIGERVIRETAAKELIYMMEKVISEGTGRRARLDGREAAGKTGTTQAARDAWFVGFTADYVAGVWMGYDDNTPLTGVTGGGLPAEIWHEVMVRVHEGLPARPLPMIIPQAPAPQPAPQPQQQPQSVQPEQPRQQKDPVTNFLDGLIRDLLGGGN